MVTLPKLSEYQRQSCFCDRKLSDDVGLDSCGYWILFSELIAKNWTLWGSLTGKALLTHYIRNRSPGLQSQQKEEDVLIKYYKYRSVYRTRYITLLIKLCAFPALTNTTKRFISLPLYIKGNLILRTETGPVSYDLKLQISIHMSKEFASCSISCFYPTFPRLKNIMLFFSVCRPLPKAAVVPQFQNALKREKKYFSNALIGETH